MAWPLSRLVTFVARTTPTINADDFLNAIQDWAVALSLGVVTLKGLVVDGVGGQSATGVPGSGLFSRELNSTTVPTPEQNALGEHHKHSAPSAMGTVAPGNNQVDCGWGIYATEELAGTGYRITLHAKPTGADPDRSVILSMGAFGAGAYEWTNKQVDGQGRLQFELRGSSGRFVSFAVWVF